MVKTNQCDGCRAGKPLNEHGHHQMGAIVKYGKTPELPRFAVVGREHRRPDYTDAYHGYVDLQACTAERYGHEPGCPPDGPHCSRCGYCEFKLSGEQCLCYAR